MALKRASLVSFSMSFMARTMAPAARKPSSFRSVRVVAPEAVSTSKRPSTNFSRWSTGSRRTHSFNARSFRRPWRETSRSVTKPVPSTCQEKPSCCQSPAWSLSTTV